MVAKRAQTYQDLLKNRHTTQRGGSMTDIREQNPGSLDAPHVCGACLMPWVGAANKCMGCGSPNKVNHVPDCLGGGWRGLDTERDFVGSNLASHRSPWHGCIAGGDKRSLFGGCH